MIIVAAAQDCVYTDETNNKMLNLTMFSGLRLAASGGISSFGYSPCNDLMDCKNEYGMITQVYQNGASEYCQICANWNVNDVPIYDMEFDMWMFNYTYSRGTVYVYWECDQLKERWEISAAQTGNDLVGNTRYAVGDIVMEIKSKYACN